LNFTSRKKIISPPATAALSEIAFIKKGNEKAFTAVYSKYHLKLYRYFLKKIKWK